MVRVFSPLLPAAAGSKELIQQLMARWRPPREAHRDPGIRQIDPQNPVEDDEVGDGLTRPQAGRPLIDIQVLAGLRPPPHPQLVTTADDGAIGQQYLERRPRRGLVQAQADERWIVLVELADVVGEDGFVKTGQIGLHQLQHPVVAVGRQPALFPLDVERREAARHQNGIGIAPPAAGRLPAFV